MNNIDTLTIILLGAIIFGHLFSRLGLSTILGQLIFGMLFGSNCFHIINSSPVISQFSQFGIIFIMFLSGNNSNLARTRLFLKHIFTIALCNLIISMTVLNALFIIVFNYNISTSLCASLTLATTAISISAVILKEFHMLNTAIGTIISMSATINNVLGLIILDFLPYFVKNNTISFTNHEIYLFISIIIFQVLFITLIFILLKYSQTIFYVSTRLLIPFNSTIVSLVFCLITIVISNYISFPTAVSAFLTGICISTTDQSKKVYLSLQPICDVMFAPIFFVSMGLNLSIKGFFSSWIFIIVTVIITIILKLTSNYLGAKIWKMSKKSAKLISKGMLSGGGMALITAKVGYNSNLISDQMYSNLVLVIILITIFAAPFLRFELLHYTQSKGSPTDPLFKTKRSSL